ncbi:LysR family transcriptional regulator [Rhizobium binxianense]
MSRITLAQIEAFFWVAELGSVQKAANKLNITQPTLSLRLQQLRNELSVPVFERIGRSLHLTREGHAFLKHARIVLAAYRELQHAAAPSEITGRLRIGLAEGFAVACLPAMIPVLRREFPLLQPEWTIGTSLGLEERLADGDLDLAVLVDPAGLADIRLFALGLQRNVWAAPARMKNIDATPKSLNGSTIITSPPSTSMYRLTSRWFAEGRLQPESLCICSSLNAGLQLVGAGIGLGIFPEKMVLAYPLAGDIVTLASTPRPIDSQVFLASREQSDELAASAFLRVLLAVTDRLDYFARLD